MPAPKHIVIFSHGFGTKKDDRGLLSGEHGIAEALQEQGIETILFDYNDVNEDTQYITVRPLSIQIKMLADVIAESRERNEDVIIDIIAHSQGCITPAKLMPEGIRKIIFVAPSLDVNNQRMIDQFKDRPGTIIDLEGTSTFGGRKDGTTTIVPKEYWVERGNALPIPLFNALSKITELTMIRPNQDDILGNMSIDGLSKEIKVIYLDGNHGFHGEKDRTKLIETIKNILI